MKATKEEFLTREEKFSKIMEEKGITFKKDSTPNPLVCIANIKTEEVLRIPYSEAVKFLSQNKSDWKFTEKRIYKQYIDSKLEGNNIPAPKFHRILYINGKEAKEAINVYLGHPSYRISHKKSSDNKAGKYRYQYIPKTVVITEDKEGNLVTNAKEARTIRHLK